MSDMVLGEDIGSLGFDSHAKFAHNKVKAVTIAKLW